MHRDQFVADLALLCEGPVASDADDLPWGGEPTPSDCDGERYTEPRYVTRHAWRRRFEDGRDGGVDLDLGDWAAHTGPADCAGGW